LKFSGHGRFIRKSCAIGFFAHGVRPEKATKARRDVLKPVSVVAAYPIHVVQGFGGVLFGIRNAYAVHPILARKVLQLEGSWSYNGLINEQK
jgi:hypothetical protein